MKRRLHTTFDTALARYVRRLPKSLYTPFVIVGAIIRPGVWAAVLVAFLVHFYLTQQNTLALYTVVMLAFLPLSSLVKILVRRKRPNSKYLTSLGITSYSFPSSHVYAATMGAVFVSTIFATMPGVVLAVSFVVFIVALSRVYVDAHYPTDVLGAILLGVIAGGMISVTLGMW